MCAFSSGAPPAGHALLDAGCDQALTERGAQKLTAAIAVKDHAGPGASTTQRRVHQGADTHGISRRGEPPGQYGPRVLVQYHREIPPPTGNGKIRAKVARSSTRDSVPRPSRSPSYHDAVRGHRSRPQAEPRVEASTDRHGGDAVLVQ